MKNILLRVKKVHIFWIGAILLALFFFLQSLLQSDIEKHEDIIRISNIQKKQVIDRPVSIQGEARGTWFSEASFPIAILDNDDNVLGEVVAVALDDWMTEEFVPFQAVTSFLPSTTKKGMMVFKKNNLSDLRELDDEVHLPILFGNKKVKLYYPKGADSCDEKILVPVVRYVVGEDVIKETIKLLIEGELRPDERELGFSTAFPNSNFSLKNISKDDSVLTLEFTNARAFTTGDACHVSLLKAQIEQTAKQFFGVRKVQFVPEDLFGL